MIEVSEREYIQLAEALFLQQRLARDLPALLEGLSAGLDSLSVDRPLTAKVFQMYLASIRSLTIADQIIMDAARREAAERSVEHGGSTSTETGEGDAGGSEHLLAGEPRG